MKTRKESKSVQPGKFLTRVDREAMQRQRRSSTIRRCRRYMMVTVLLLWDGLLLYMIIQCLIDRVYGAVFIAVISVYMGYFMK